VKDNFNGLLCRLKDADDLAEKMKMMAGFENTTLKLFGENGRAKMEAEYSESIVIDKYLQTICELRKVS
jgi:glycosyltransferase involved in cell wall biosynthesis